MERNISKTQGSLRDVNKLLKLNPANTELLSQKYAGLQKAISETEKKLDALKEADKKAKEALNNGEISKEQYDALQREIIDTENKLKSLKDTVGSGSAKFAEFSAKAGEFGNKMSDAGKKIMPVSAGFAALGFAAGKSAVDFESAFAGVEKTVEGTDKQLASIRQGILDLSKTTSSSAPDIAAVAEAAGQLGIKTPDIMKFTETMVKLGDTTNLSAEEAASALAKFANITGTSADDYDRLGSVIVDLGNNFATTESDIVSMSTRLASSGNLAGLSEPQIMALATAMSSVGIEAEAGGTAMSKLIKQMQVSVETGNGQMEKFASVAGMTGEQFKAAFQEDAVGALGAFISGLNDTERNGASATAVLEDMGLTEARLSNTILSLASSGDLLTDTLDTATGAWKNNNALNKEAQKRYETTAAKLSQAKAAIVELGVSLGDTLLPMVKSGAEGLKKFADKLSKAGPVTKKLMVGMIGIGAAAGPTLSAIGKVSTGVSALAGWMSKASNAAKLAAISNSGLGNASKKLFGILKANPYAAVAAGAVAMGAAIFKAVQATHEETNAAREAAKSREENITSVKSQQKEAEFYRQKLEELSGVENKSASQKQLMQAYVDRLNESVDGLNLTYDAEADKLNQTTEAIKNKIKAQQEEALAAAYQKQAQAALEDYAEAQIKAGEIHDELAAKKKEWNKLSDSEKQTNGELAREISNLKREYEDAAGSADVYLQESIKLSNANAKQSGSWKELLNQAGITGKQLAPTLVEGINSGKYVIPTTVDELNALIKFDEAAQKATGDGQKTAANLAQQMRNGKINVQSAADELSNAVAAGTGKAPAKAGAQGKQSASSFAAGVSSGKGKSESSGEKIGNAGVEGTKKADWNTAGRNDGAGYAKGLRGAMKTVAEAGAAIAAAALAAAKKASDQHSPSKKWAASARMDVKGYINEMKRQAPYVEKAGAAIANAAMDGQGSAYGKLPVGSMEAMKTNITQEFDYAQIYRSMKAAIKEAQFTIVLDRRELGRGLRGMGVQFA